MFVRWKKTSRASVARGFTVFHCYPDLNSSLEGLELL